MSQNAVRLALICVSLAVSVRAFNGVRAPAPLREMPTLRSSADCRRRRPHIYSSPRAIVSYSEALLVAPEATKCATAAALGLLGDGFAQAAEKKGQPFDFDGRRSAAMTVFALTYTGLFQAWWIQQLGEWVHMDAPVAEAAVKTFLCQFGTIPLIYMPMFFGITGALRGEEPQATAERAKADYLRIYSRNVGFWIPVQMIQFFYVDPSWQITYLSAMGLVWNTILSLIGLRAQPQPAASDGSFHVNEDSETVEESDMVGTGRPRQ